MQSIRHFKEIGANPNKLLEGGTSSINNKNKTDSNGTHGARLLAYRIGTKSCYTCLLHFFIDMKYIVHS